MDAWLEGLFANDDLLKMGHCQRPEDKNLGMGWLYYGLARLVRSGHAVVIGSWRGFAPIVLGRALLDNIEGGQVVFLDPSLVDDFWKDPEAVAAHFARYGAPNVVHFPMTTQEFVATEEYSILCDIGLVLIDGLHTAEQAQLDFEAFLPLLAPTGIVLFHDSCSDAVVGCYGPDRAYRRSVSQYLDTLKQDARFQVLDLPIATGLTMVRLR